LDRREFVVGTSLAISGLGTITRGAAGKMMVGAHPWVYAANQPGYDIYPILDGIFADMAYAGMDGIELMHTALYPEEAPARINELAKKNQLTVIGTSYEAEMWNREAHPKIRDNARMVISRLSQVGGRTLGISVGRAGRRKMESELDAQAEILKEVLQLCADSGVRPNLHNHTYEVEDGMHDLRGTLARVPEARLGPDLNWLQRAGIDPVRFISEFGDRIVFLHLRDQNRDGRWSEALGEGSMDYPAIAEALRKIDFSGEAVIELAHEGDFEPSRPLRESLKMSRQYVGRVFGW